MHHFHIPGMKCGGCLGAIIRTIQKVDPHARIEGDVENREIKVISDKAESSLLSALSEAGYPAQRVQIPAE